MTDGTAGPWCPPQKKLNRAEMYSTLPVCSPISISIIFYLSYCHSFYDCQYNIVNCSYSVQDNGDDTFSYRPVPNYVQAKQPFIFHLSYIASFTSNSLITTGSGFSDHIYLEYVPDQH